MSRGCCVALLHDVMGLSAVCDCGISYSLTIYKKKHHKHTQTHTHTHTHTHKKMVSNITITLFFSEWFAILESTSKSITSSDQD